MPTYVYHCDYCDTNFEARQKFTDSPLTVCPRGHEGVRRVITPSAIIFKGSGWYITDSKSGGNKTVESKGSNNSDKGDGKADSPKDATSESVKSESKSESSPAGSENKSSKAESNASPAV